jgi:hypothetical protein
MAVAFAKSADPQAQQAGNWLHPDTREWEASPGIPQQDSGGDFEVPTATIHEAPDIEHTRPHQFEIEDPDLPAPTPRQPHTSAIEDWTAQKDAEERDAAIFEQGRAAARSGGSE